MCGIIAVVRRRTSAGPLDPAAVLDPLHEAVRLLAEAADLEPGGPAALEAAIGHLRNVDTALRGVDGVALLLGTRDLAVGVANLVTAAEASVVALEDRLDAGDAAGLDLEHLNVALVEAKDLLWAVGHDRLRTAEAVAGLAGPALSGSTLDGAAALASGAPRSVVTGFLSVQEALSALDRLEVRGRDSAGLHVLVRGHHLDLDDPTWAAQLADRGTDHLFSAGSVRSVEGTLSFVYKAAAEIGELGDNTNELRRLLRNDTLLRAALESESSEVVVLGHTRWASIGIISQFNAHPLNSEELEGDTPYTVAVLNGDVDNFADLKAADGLAIAPEITTDAKVIPALTSRRLAAGDKPFEAFRSTVNRLEGSVAIGLCASATADELLLALRGSGQALYIGVADDAWIVASEPYGVVEVTPTYLRMDGETPSDPSNPAATRGQIVSLSATDAGRGGTISRWSYDGTELPVTGAELADAQITTRDIDRGSHPHYLLKEITEAPTSFRKTLRGKLVERDGQLAVDLGPDVVPDAIRARLAAGSFRRVVGIGQGTAAVAAASFVTAVRTLVPDGRLHAEATLATELSGFGLESDMSDTLVVAISQSGTTTDTNRTVDLVRGRGAAVLAVVNRRNSDLAEKADGVLYTSDGRDVEMSVASTKAFYSQVGAGFLLAVALAEAVNGVAPGTPATGHQDLLAALRDLPALMQRTLEVRPAVADAARRFAPSRRYWAIVGNGPNRIAASEVRIKASELCYKSIASDGTEDKKHIDLSSEPLILVCAAGLSGSNADDVAKEVAIYRAHKAVPVVIASEGEERFGAAMAAVFVPATHPALAFVLSAMAGHLFSYEAALAIDAQARPLREVRAGLETVVAAGVNAAGAGREPVPARSLLEQLAPVIEQPAARFLDGLRVGDYDGHLEASTAVRIVSLLRFALGVVPLDGYQLEHGKVGTPSTVVEDLATSLTAGIEQLTRPVDAIKHQAKTVTVGISRSDESLLEAGLVKEVLGAGVARDRLTYDTLRTLASLEALVEGVLGYTRYRVDGRLDGDDDATVSVVDTGGIGSELRSRTADNPVLRGTKRRVAAERRVLLARGAADGRTVLIVPEVKDNHTTGITLLHVSFRRGLGVPALRTALSGYRERYAALRDAVLETEPSFRDDVLASVDVVELMTTPISDLADRHWRSGR
jgi:glutamine---fructose-6-phosphate transaminase (isomerizing)